MTSLQSYLPYLLALSFRWHSSSVVNCNSRQKERSRHSKRAWTERKRWPILDSWTRRASDTN